MTIKKIIVNFSLVLNLIVAYRFGVGPFRTFFTIPPVPMMFKAGNHTPDYQRLEGKNMTDRDMACPTVVVVNDDVIQLRVLSSMLEQESFDVLTFETAGEALKAMDPAAPPNLIVTDLHMPGIDGWRFCRLLRSMEYDAFNPIPILVVSATFSGEDVRQITARLGADAFLPAPIRAATFIKQVNSLLKGRTSRIKTHVLIVDPDTAGSQALKSSFEYGGYYATIAYSGLEAVKCLREHAAEIIVLEYQLPDTSGDQLLRELRRIAPQGVFIMTTHDPRPELAVGWMQRGAAAYVRKPFDPQYLITLCENACRERALLHVEDILEERTRELLSSEARYRFIYDNSPVMMHSIDQEGRFCDVNWKWLIEMGYERDCVIGRDAYFMVAPESPNPSNSGNTPVFGHQSVTDFPCRFRKKRRQHHRCAGQLRDGQEPPGEKNQHLRGTGCHAAEADGERAPEPGIPDPEIRGAEPHGRQHRPQLQQPAHGHHGQSGDGRHLS